MPRSVFGWLALLAADALIVILGWQNRMLRQDRDWLTDRVSYAYPGMYVPILERVDTSGDMQTLGAPSGKSQILFFFDHTCPYCLKSAPTVAKAARRVGAEFGDNVSVIGVCQCDRAQAAAYAGAQGFEFPLLIMREHRELMLYRARRVPLLLVIDRAGRVRHAVQGVFDTEEHVEQLLTALRYEDVEAADSPSGEPL